MPAEDQEQDPQVEETPKEDKLLDDLDPEEADTEDIQGGYRVAGARWSDERQ